MSPDSSARDRLYVTVRTMHTNGNGKYNYSVTNEKIIDGNNMYRRSFTELCRIVEITIFLVGIKKKISSTWLPRLVIVPLGNVYIYN